MQATEPLNGSNPRFWGRYFNGTDNRKYQYNRDPVQYNGNTVSENEFLSAVNIPVLCWARQMWAVSDAYASVAADHAKKNMQGVIAAFGAQYLFNSRIVPTLYLDLEPESGYPEHVMAQAYYTNWSAAIVAGLTAGGYAIKFRPAGYLNLGDNGQSFLNLNAACAAGSVCDGVWPARYVKADENSAPPQASDMQWSNDPPAHDSFPPGQPDQHIPKIGWQYFGNYQGDVDFDMVNPAYETLVMKGVVPSP